MNSSKLIGLLRAILVLGLSLAAGALAAQTTFTINSLGDDQNSDPGDGRCWTGVQIWVGPVRMRECTLRAALEEANATAGPVIIEIHQDIERNIAVARMSVIEVSSALPYISNKVTIAGETHPDWEQDGATHLVIRGPGGGFSGLRFSSGAAGSTVRNIGIQGFGQNGILLSGGGDHTIQYNVLGGAWTPYGYAPAGNGANGLAISGSNSNTIRNNSIRANGGNGIRIYNGSAQNLMQDNVIGLIRTGSSGVYSTFGASGNGDHGVFIADSAGPGNAVGFINGNTISNNGKSGILVEADEQVVMTNHIGVPHPGGIAPGYESADYGNGRHGLEIGGSDNIIGTGGSGRNVIGNSQDSGILLFGAASGNEISSNRIGTNLDGEDLGMSDGIRITASNGTSPANLIVNNHIAYNTRGISVQGSGGFIRRNRITDNNTGVLFDGPGQLGSLDIADANVIGNNDTGVWVFGSNNGLVLIRNNYIGTDASGASLGNIGGISVYGADSTVRIGGSGNGNVIVNNTSHGINLRQGASDVIISGNLIGVHSNGEPMGNRAGIAFGNSTGSNASNNQVGYKLSDVINPATWSPGSDEGNVIAHNNEGISFGRADDNSTGNVIRGNSIHSNGPAGTRGIDLGMEELDIGGAATGPNNLMNYPDFDVAATEYDAGAGEINYRVRVQTTPANADYPLTIDFYLTDGSSPQGKTFIGSMDYPVWAAFEFRTGTLAVSQPVDSSTYLVATATDASGNTSQFSNQPWRLITSDALFSDRFE